MKRLLVACVLVLGILGGGPALAQGQLVAYVKMDGIAGTSLDPMHKDWIEAWSITQSVDHENMRSACGLQFTKGLDIAGPKIWFAAATSKLIPNATVEVVASGGNWQFLLYRIELSNVVVTALTSETASTGSAPTEKVQLTSAKVQLTYWTLGLIDGGVPPAPETVVVDCGAVLLPSLFAR